MNEYERSEQTKTLINKQTGSVKHQCSIFRGFRGLTSPGASQTPSFHWPHTGLVKNSQKYLADPPLVSPQIEHVWLYAPQLNLNTSNNYTLPSENGITRSPPKNFPSLSRNRSGLNSSGSGQTLGSMWALYKLTITWKHKTWNGYSWEWLAISQNACMTPRIVTYVG